jgi:hypothetical protein
VPTKDEIEGHGSSHMFVTLHLLGSERRPLSRSGSKEASQNEATGNVPSSDRLG